MQPPDPSVRYRLTLPALVYLVLTLLSGLLIRYLWYSPGSVSVHVPYLIHAHSHIALLGWLFTALASGILLRFVSMEMQKRLIPLWLIIPLHLLLLVMTIAFAKDGYAALSIITSTLLVLLTSWMVVLILEQIDQQKPGSFLIKAALWMYLLSNAGPLALAGGTFMGQQWIQFWVAYYLHLQFSGWITLAVIGLLHNLYANGTTVSFNEKTITLLYIAGMLLSFESFLRTDDSGLTLQFVGFSGGVILAYVTIVFLLQWRKSWTFSLIRDVLPVLGILSLLLKAGMHLAGGLPLIGTLFTSGPLLAIAYAHWVLVGLATSILLYFILPEVTPLPSPMWTRFLTATGVVLYSAGTVAMLLLLLFFGLLQLFQGLPPFSMQGSLLLSGIVMLTGLLMVTPAIIAHPKRSF